MKVIFTTTTEPQEDDAIVIQDVSIVNILLEDAEATEIFVDDFLSSYNYRDAGNVLNLILSKLRIGGKIVIQLLDVELVAWQLSRNLITVEMYNNIVFYKPIKSMFTCSIVEDLLKSFDVNIESKKIISDTGMAIITGIRNAA